MNCGKVLVIFGGVTIETGLNFELFMNEFVCKEKKVRWRDPNPLPI